MDKLTLQRVSPKPGQAVSVAVLWNEESCGTLLVPWKGWIKLKKLLEKGIEADAREQKPLQLRLLIEGVKIAEEQPVEPLAELDALVPVPTEPEAERSPQLLVIRSLRKELDPEWQK
jgi:hypothetical protein